MAASSSIYFQIQKEREARKVCTAGALKSKAAIKWSKKKRTPAGLRMKTLNPW